MTDYGVTATSQIWRNEKDLHIPEGGGGGGGGGGDGGGAVVQLVRLGNQSITGPEDITWTVTPFSPTPPGYDASGLFDGSSTVTITDDTAGYWEIDCKLRIATTVLGSTPEVHIELGINLNGDLLQSDIFDIAPGLSDGDSVGPLSLDLKIPTFGVNLVAGDAITVFGDMSGDMTNVSFSFGFLRMRQIVSGGTRRWVQLSTSSEGSISGEAIPAFDTVDGDAGLLNTVALDSGELGSGAIGVGLAYVHPADAEAQYVEFDLTGEISDLPPSTENWGLQVGLLKNGDFFGGSSTHFGQQLVATDTADASNFVVNVHITKRVFMEPGDYAYMMCATNLSSSPLLSSNCVFIAEMVGAGS